MTNVSRDNMNDNTYVAFLRGINVGGKNKISMAELTVCFESLGYENVHTYIASGNVIFTSQKSTTKLAQEIESILPQKFKLDSELIKILILSRNQLQQVVNHAPKGFGDDISKYYSDVIFLIGVLSDEAIKIFNPREGVDKIWQGNGVIYSQRLGSERTKSRLGVIAKYPIYKQMTIRSWNTVVKLLALMNQAL
jgi:uncharacterized protein (DUF1697 family)